MDTLNLKRVFWKVSITETTANTISAALAIFAVDQDTQAWLYDSIIDAIGDKEPTYNDYEKLDDVLITFYEAMRLFRSFSPSSEPNDRSKATPWCLQ